MNKAHQIEKVYRGFFTISIIENIMTFGLLVSIPADTDTAVLCGFSLRRLLLLGLLLFLGVLSLTGLISVKRNHKKILSFHANLTKNPQKAADLFMLTFFVLFATAGFLLAPRDYYGRYLPFFERLLPLLVYLSLLSTQYLLVLIITLGKKSELRIRYLFHQNLEKIKTTAFFFGIFLLLWLIVAVSGVGIRKPESLWVEGGVPILPFNVFITGGLLLFIVYFSNRFLNASVNNGKTSRKVDLLISIILVAAAAIYWILTPLESNYFVQGPYNIVPDYLPYSDALNWDVGGQYALIGQGIANKDPYVDHAAYMAFLAFLHLIIGNNFHLLVMVQTVIFSMFAVFAYWIGREIHSREAGFFFAILLILRQITAIKAGSVLNLSHVKLMMTEIPIAIGLAMLTLLIIKALQEEKIRIWYLLPAGAITSLMILTRLNTLIIPVFIIPGIMLFPGLSLNNRWKFNLTFTGSLMISLIPWMVRTWIIAGTPFFFLGKTMRLLSDKFRTSWLTPDIPTVQELLPLGSASALRFLLNNGIFITVKSAAAVVGGMADVVFQTINHFFHNLVTSVVAYPLIHFPFYSLNEAIFQKYPFWNQLDGIWTGQLTLLSAIGIFINLVLIALGLGKSWVRWKAAGLVPLFFFLTYHASTAVARTSGGRYLASADWLLIIYYVIGLVELARITVALLPGFFKPAKNKPQPASSGKGLSLALFLPMITFLVGMVVLDLGIPQKYTRITFDELATYPQIYSEKSETSFTDKKELHKYMEADGGLAVNGSLLYPRYYNSGQIETSYLLGGKLTQYPRLEFTAATPDGEKRIVFPIDRIPNGINQGGEVIALGCPQSRNDILLARLLIIKGAKTSVLFTPSEFAELTRDCKVDYLTVE